MTFTCDYCDIPSEAEWGRYTSRYKKRKCLVCLSDELLVDGELKIYRTDDGIVSVHIVFKEKLFLEAAYGWLPPLMKQHGYEPIISDQGGYWVHIKHEDPVIARLKGRQPLNAVLHKMREAVLCQVTGEVNASFAMNIRSHKGHKKA